MRDYVPIGQPADDYKAPEEGRPLSDLLKERYFLAWTLFGNFS
jgi:hypothetical protein